MCCPGTELHLYCVLRLGGVSVSLGPDWRCWSWLPGTAFSMRFWHIARNTFRIVRNSLWALPTSFWRDWWNLYQRPNRSALSPPGSFATSLTLWRSMPVQPDLAWTTKTRCWILQRCWISELHQDYVSLSEPDHMFFFEATVPSIHPRLNLDSDCQTT